MRLAPLSEREPAQARLVGCAGHATLGDDGGDQLVRCDIECGIGDGDSGRRDLTIPDVGYFGRIAVLNRDVVAVRTIEIES